MSNHALQDDLGSPAGFGSMPGELNELLKHPGPSPEPITRYDYGYCVEVVEVGTGKVLEQQYADDHAEQTQIAEDLAEKWSSYHREVHKVTIYSAPIIASRRPHTPESLAALQRVVESVASAKAKRAERRGR